MPVNFSLRKALLLFLFACSFLCLPACKEDREAELTHLWYFRDGDITIDLKTDRSFVAEERDRIYNGTWALSGDTLKMINEKGRPMQFVIRSLEGDHMVVNSNGEEMVFQRLDTVEEPE